MMAAVLVEQNMPLVLAEVDIPNLDVGQVLVKVKNSGICGKQLDEIYGTRGVDPYLPHLLGHEGSGIVMDVGPGVRKVQIGDHVVLHWMKGSGIDSVTPDFRARNLGHLTKLNAGWVTTFSEYTVVSENRITKIPSDLSFEAACLLGCAVTTGLGIVYKDAQVTPGQSIAVFGAGGVGLNVIQGAALVNASPIVALDLYDKKLDRAKSFGATHTINTKDNVATETALECNGGKRFDVTVNTTGNPEAFDAAYDLTDSTGSTVLVGLIDKASPISLDAYPLHGGRRLIASHGGETNPDVDIPNYIKLYNLGRLKLEEQITARFPLSNINEAIDLFRQGVDGRCVISMSDE